MNKEVVIVGASGHGKVVADIIRTSGDSIVGFLDDNPEIPERFMGFPVLEKWIDFKNIKIIIL